MGAKVAVVDCAVKKPGIVCFNGLVHHFDRPFTYHIVPQTGLSSLTGEGAAAEDFQEAGGYIVFGSASNVEERLGWQVDLARFLKTRLLAGIPVLGICFGHQLVADAFGATVCRAEKPRRGIREITFLEDRLGFRADERRWVFTYHGYEVGAVNERFVHLATSPQCFYEALALKDCPYLGFQGHPEASRPFVVDDIRARLSAQQMERGRSDGRLMIGKFLELLK